MRWHWPSSIPSARATPLSEVRVWAFAALPPPRAEPAPPPSATVAPPSPKPAQRSTRFPQYTRPELPADWKGPRLDGAPTRPHHTAVSWVAGSRPWPIELVPSVAACAMRARVHQRGVTTSQQKAAKSSQGTAICTTQDEHTRHHPLPDPHQQPLHRHQPPTRVPSRVRCARRCSL